MRVYTCLKEVPDRDTRYQINPDETGIELGDVTFDINECDEYSLEESLKLAEAHIGEVCILSVGPERAEKSIRKGLAMGADRAVLVVDDEVRADTPHSVAAALAEVLKQEEYDLVLAGTQSDDRGYTQTGVILAELLGLPHATLIMEVEVDSEARQVKALREMESGWFQWVEMALPAVLTIQAGISQVRYASLKGIMQAKHKEIRKVPLADLALDYDSMPRLEVARLYVPEAETKAEMLQGDPQSVVEQLVEKLKKEAKVL